MLSPEQSNYLPELAARIRAEHEATASALRSGIQHAIAAGELLIEAKAQLPHGQWLPWLKDNCALSLRQAQKYMRLARSSANTPLKAHLTIDEALDALAEPKLRLLPPAGFVRIGGHDDGATHTSLIVAPSQQSPGYFYVTCIQGNLAEGGWIDGSHKPIRHDYVARMAAAATLQADLTQFDWYDTPASAWTHNHLLHDPLDCCVQRVFPDAMAKEEGRR
jgi:hypothetical protein